MFLRSSRGGEGWLPGSSIEDDEDEGRGVGGAWGGLSSISRGMSASKQQDVLAQFKVGGREGRPSWQDDVPLPHQPDSPAPPPPCL